LRAILLFILLALCVLPGQAGQGPDTVIPCHYQNVPFSEFCASVGQQSGVSIYFRSDWVKSLTVTMNIDSISVSDALKMALRGTGLSVSTWHGNLVLTKRRALITALPEYSRPGNGESERSAVQGLTESEQRYLQGRKAGDAEVIRIGQKSFGSVPAKVKILGKITEEETGEDVIGAAMLIEELATGITSDKNGVFTLAIKPGVYNVIFEFLGLEKRKCILEVNGSGEFSIEMKKVVIPIGEVVVIGDRQINVTSRDPGLERISARTVSQIPTMMGERDILKVSEMMPGIVSVGEGSSGLNVRGGSSDQNAFYINKIPVYNTSHLFGFFPAFNSDIVKDFSVYKGYVPAQYGGRLSSVFDIITRQGNRKQFNAHASINPVTASLTLEGPLVKDKSSILLSGRSSYSDWILNRINDLTISASSARFNDLALSLNYDFKKTQVSLFGFNSYDYFKLSDITRYEYGNTGASMNVRHNFSTAIQGEFSLIGSRYNFQTVSTEDPNQAYKHGYTLEHYEARFDFNHVTLSKHNLEYGLGILLNRLDRGKVMPYGESERGDVALGREQGLEGSAYISDRIDLADWLNVNVGVRYSVFSPLGPKTVYTYGKDLPVDPRYIEDTLFFGSNEPIRWNHYPELRATINLETDENGSVKIAFNQMHQSAFMLTNTISVAPNTQWKLSDYYLKPARSNQVSLGVFRNMPTSGWETSVEVYYKLTDKFLEFKDGADFLSGNPTETMMLQGKQSSYGFELSVKRTGRKLNGWLAYTYSRSLVQIDGGESWNRINGGRVYPANYDIPHALNALINYSVTRRISLSSVLTYQTGRPITYPLSVYYVNSIAYTDYSDRNQYNIPDYFRTDLSATFEGSLRKNKLFHSSLVFSVYNLTGRKNAYSVYFKNEAGFLNSYKYSVIGVPIVTVTWLIKLGNYASE
jgi:hypothetical protein